MFYSVYMSLSDRERRLLAEMEAALATDDPGLESKLAGSTMTATKPRLLLALALVVLGIGVIFAALISKTTPVGVVGFLELLAKREFLGQQARRVCRVFLGSRPKF